MKLITLILILFICSCEKDSNDCWTCTEKWSGHINGSNTWEVCDVLQATKLNGKRVVKYTTLANNVKAVTTYITTCQQ